MILIDFSGFSHGFGAENQGKPMKINGKSMKINKKFIKKAMQTGFFRGHSVPNVDCNEI